MPKKFPIPQHMVVEQQTLQFYHGGRFAICSILFVFLGIPSIDSPVTNRGLGRPNLPKVSIQPEGHFTHKIESPRPFHFKHSHWSRRWSWSKFASHYARGTNGVCERKMDVKLYLDSYMASNGSCFMVTWDNFRKPPLGGTSNNTKSGDHATPNITLCRSMTMLCGADSNMRKVSSFSLNVRNAPHTTVSPT